MHDHMPKNDNTRIKDLTPLLRMQLKAIAGVSTALLDVVDRQDQGLGEVVENLEDIADLARTSAGKLEPRRDAASDHTPK